MNILFVTGHPAQIHHFKNVKMLLEKRGHSVFWAASSKEISFELLRHENIDFIEVLKPGKGIFSKIKTLLINNWKLARFIKDKNIQYVVSRVSPFVSLACKVRGVYHLGISDTEKSGVYDTLFTKLLNAFITAESFRRTLRKDQIRIKSNTELFYLHKNHFQPNREQLEAHGIDFSKPYSVVRFVSWNAYHDKGQSGFNYQNQLELISTLAKYTTVYISGESELPNELKVHALKIPSHLMHELLYFASIYVGEGASMAAEASLLGTPSILVNDIKSGNGDDMEKHGILKVFTSSDEEQQQAINCAEEILNNRESKTNFRKKLDVYLEDKIDGSAFLVWFIEQGSRAKSIMLNNPEFQNKFK